jgi:hypothetical protein
MFILSKCVFWIQIQFHNSNSSFEFLVLVIQFHFFPTSNWSKGVMSNSFAPQEFTIPPRRETRSPLGFSDKSAKKYRNFRCYAQKPSILPRSCPTCWDITDHNLLTIDNYSCPPPATEYPIGTVMNQPCWVRTTSKFWHLIFPSISMSF